MKKRTLYIGIAGLLIMAALLAVLLGQGNAKVSYGINLLKNADFERVTGEDLPEDWLPDAYQRMPGTSLFELTGGRTGQGILVHNMELNDARFMQTVSVAPNTLYELSGYVKAGAEGGRGANISIADVYVEWVGLMDTGDAWEQIKVYGRTGPQQRELTVYARLGGYSSESLGRAGFDDLALMAVEQVPDGADVYSWETWKPDNSTQTDFSQPAPAWPWLLGIAFIWAWFARDMARRAELAAQRDLSREHKRLFDSGLMWLLIAAFVTRVLIGILIPGYGVDVGCFTAWSDRMYHVGPADFYITEQHSDYPPGYMLALWPIGLVGSALGTGATELMIKLPAIIADIAAIVLIYHYVSEQFNRKTALWLAAMYAFNPLVYVTGAAWGQVDSIPTALIMLVILLIYKGKWGAALPVYTLSVLMKPQALMFGPLGLAAFVLYLLRGEDKQRWKQALAGIGISLALALAVILPFSPKQEGAGWLIKLYSGTMTFYGYATVNATNLYFLFGLNWQPIGSAAPLLLRLAGALSLIVPVCLYLYKGSKEPASRERVLLLLSLLPAAACLAPMSLSLTGTLLMISGFLIILVRFLSEGSVYNLPLLGAVMLVAFCALGVMMHERYLFPAIGLLMLAYAKRRDRSILVLMIALSILAFMNVGIALDRGVRIGGVPGHLAAPLYGIDSESDWLEYIISAGQVLVSAMAVFVGLTQSRLSQPLQPVKPAGVRDDKGIQAQARHNAAAARLLSPHKNPRIDGRDCLIMLLVTLIYAVPALTNLGAMKAPQTSWVSSAEDSEVVLDLGEGRRFQMLYYPGIEQRWESEFNVSVSDDMQQWTTYAAQMDPGNCFQWMTVNNSVRNGSPAVLEGRYVKIAAPNRLTTIMEVLARDADSEVPIKLSLAAGKGEALIDEQDSLDGDPSWYNSAYFDEIYHARTGYEHANAIRGTDPNNTYEISHPPLGKVFMAFSILKLGMTPFAWRLPGALAGVLMLPAMYLMGKLLTKKRLFGFAAIALMALDGMHFAQTRIATIDSFVTLFIIWSYYFMFRYALDGDAGRSLKGDMINLALSGLFMGLAIASKWTGMYAGAGLALIFFWALARRVKEGLEARELSEDASLSQERREGLSKIADNWQHRTLLTLAWCVLFFVISPALIYYVSFYPWFMRTSGGLTVQKVWDASTYMFDYHSEPGRGMDHAFYSPWYQWPLMNKPFYFYAGKRIGDTGSTIMSFGNPAVWWGGFAAVLILSGLWLMRRLRPKAEDGEDIRPVLVILSYLAQYVPWMLVPRGTYLYHYFPSVPFIILAAVLALCYLYRKNERLGRIVTAAYLVIGLALFIGFFPYYSGIRVSAAWLNAMRWLPRIYY